MSVKVIGVIGRIVPRPECFAVQEMSYAPDAVQLVISCEYS